MAKHWTKKLSWSTNEVEVDHPIQTSSEYRGPVQLPPPPSTERESILKPELPRHNEVKNTKEVNPYALPETIKNTKKFTKLEKIQQKNEKIQKNQKSLEDAELLGDSPNTSVNLSSVLHSGVLPRFVVAVSLADATATIPILLDSGAGESFIRRSVLDALQLTDKIQQCYPYCVRGAFGQTQLVRHKVSIPLRTTSWKESVSFYVIDKLEESAIFGLPFLQKHAKLVDLEKLTFADQPCVTTPVEKRDIVDTKEQIIEVSRIDLTHLRRELKSKQQEVGLLRIDWHDDSVDNKISEVDDDSPETREILRHYADVVTNTKPATIPDLDKVSHEIHLIPDAKIPARPPYRMSAAENTALNREINELLKQGAIVPSSSPFSAPVLFVKKKDGSLRLCVDYRMLNDRTIRNRFPLPVIDDLIDSLGGARYFSKLDLMAGYHQIRVHPSDEYKTAFSTRSGHYQFRVMPFGLTNAPATFQSFMNHILSPYLHDFVVVYLDDILIYSKTKEEHQRHVKLVLDTLKANKLIAKKSKCEFFRKETSFLGFKLSTNGILPLHDKVQAVREFPTPTSIKQAQSFLGLANFYRRFIPNFSKIAAPLTQFTSKKSVWSTEQDVAFATLKERLTSSPVLLVPDLKKDFVLTTDASHECMGATLEQRNSDGSLAGVVGYWSKRLQGSQLNYSVQEQEFLAVVEALKQYRHLLIGKHFILRTDHFSLTYLMIQTKTPQGRIARWLDTLAEYDFTIEHISGVTNTAADALSRVQVSALAATPLLEDEETLQSIKINLPEDPYFGEIYSTLQNPNEDAMIPKHIRHHIRHYRLVDELLYFTTTVGSDNSNWRLCIPKVPSVRNKIFVEAHEPPSSGHFGPYKTYFMLAQHFYWPRMFKDIKTFIRSCDNCQRCKTGGKGTDGLLKPLDIPERRWSSISLDFVTGLPISNGCDAVLVVTDRLTKRGHFIATVKTIDAPGTAQLYFNEIVRLHGVPQSIVSDRDVRFVSSFWKKLHELFGSRLLFSTTNHPQTDGQTERLNRTLNNLLRAYCFNEHDSWTNYLSAVEFAYNNSYQKSIETTPFIADLGYQPATPGFHNTLRSPGYNETVEDLGTKLKAILLRIQDQMAHAQRSQEEQANKSRNAVEYEVGDLALVHRDAYAKSDTYKKIQPAYLGPFRVVKKYGDNVCEVDLPDHRKTHRKINTQYLRKYYARDSYPKIPPRTEQEAIERVREIIGIAGFDKTEKTWDLQWQDCDPTNVFTVSDDFIEQYIPDNIQDAIWQNMNQLSKNRDDSSLEGGSV